MVLITAKHWSHIDRKWWDSFSPFFSPKELACKGDGTLKIEVKSLQLLNKLREKSGGPLKINSAYRSPAYNIKVGGSPKSQHVEGTAFDIHIDNHTTGFNLEILAKGLGFKGIGRYNTFIHIDTRMTPAEWGEWNDNSSTDIA